MNIQTISPLENHLIVENVVKNIDVIKHILSLSRVSKTFEEMIRKTVSKRIGFCHLLYQFEFNYENIKNSTKVWKEFNSLIHSKLTFRPLIAIVMIEDKPIESICRTSQQKLGLPQNSLVLQIVSYYGGIIGTNHKNETQRIRNHSIQKWKRVRVWDQNYDKELPTKSWRALSSLFISRFNGVRIDLIDNYEEIPQLKEIEDLKCFIIFSTHEFGNDLNKQIISTFKSFDYKISMAYIRVKYLFSSEDTINRQLLCLYFSGAKVQSCSLTISLKTNNQKLKKKLSDFHKNMDFDTKDENTFALVFSDGNKAGIEWKESNFGQTFNAEFEGLPLMGAFGYTTFGNNNWPHFQLDEKIKRRLENCKNAYFNKSIVLMIIHMTV